MLKDSAIALTLSSLCLYRAWRLLLNPAHYYFPRTRYIELIAIVLNVLLLAAVFRAGIFLARRSGNEGLMKLARFTFLLLLLIPLNALRGEFPFLSRGNLRALFGTGGLLALGFVVVVLGVFLLARYLKLVTKVAVTLVLILSPFTAIVFAQAAWYAYKLEPNVSAIEPAPRSAARVETVAPARRVIWILFDEFDQRLAFDERPGSVSLPEFDRLRGEAFFATRAYATAGETMRAVPSLLTGRLICRSKVIGSDELQIRYADTLEVAYFRSQPNVFTRAREMGASGAALGWYHPYCTLLSGQVSYCYNQRFKETLGNTMIQQLVDSNAPAVLVPRLKAERQELRRRAQTAEYLGLMARAREAVADPRFGLVFIHLPVPHPPGIYDRARGEFSDERGRSYLDNLALADRAFGELRRALEDARLWDGATVLVSSDHWWRAPNVWKKEGTFWTSEDTASWDGKVDHRIPFILKLAGRSEGRTYDAPFNTVLTQGLLLSVLRGEVADAESVSRWLDEHRSVEDSPCNQQPTPPR